MSMTDGEKRRGVAYAIYLGGLMLASFVLVFVGMGELAFNLFFLFFISLFIVAGIETAMRKSKETG